MYSKCHLVCVFVQGFVKIARWSDMNYWALKESTEKTHRTVHKHARAFQVSIPQKGLAACPRIVPGVFSVLACTYTCAQGFFDP